MSQRGSNAGSNNNKQKRISINKSIELILIFLFLFIIKSHAGNINRSWPEFHGPDRNNISPEKNLLKKWPKKGPELLWKFSGCGKGYSGVSIAKKMLFLSGDFKDQEFVLALDMNGKLLWKSPNGESWTGPYPGARTTPTYNEGRLYQLNPTGRLASFQAGSGKEVWAIDLVGEFEARWGTWAMSENVIVDKENLYCIPGGSRALVVALNKLNGQTVWVNKELDETAAYSSSILVTYKNVKQLISLTQRSVISVDVKNGKMLWSYPFVSRYDQHVNAPIFHNGYVFVTSGHSAGAMLLKIDPDLHGAKKVWYLRKVDNCHGGMILINGNLYGSGCRLKGKKFYCLDFLTGKVKKIDTNMRKVSLAYADNMLYALSDKGHMQLLSIEKNGFEIVSKFKLLGKKKGPYLSHPVIHDGRLYLRYGNDLSVYNIRAS